MDRSDINTTAKFHSNLKSSPVSSQHQGGSARILWWLAVCSIFVIALVLRVFHIDYLSLWDDELFSRYYYDLFGPRYMLTQGLSVEPTPPLYYFVLQAWMRLSGQSAVAMRSLSVVASLVALPLVYAVARELSGRTVALAAAALFALSPMVLYFSQEARVYMLTVIPTSLMLLAIARYLRRPHPADLALYGAGAVIGLYSHATLAFMVAACNLVVIPYLLLGASASRRTPEAAPAERFRGVRNWVLANVFVGLIATPLVFMMLSIGKHGTGLSWIAPLRPGDVAIAVTALVAGVITPLRIPGVELTALLLLALGAAIISAKMPGRSIVVLVCIPSVFFLLVTIASLKQPILLPRILCWLSSPLCVALAYAIIEPSRARTAARVMVMLTFSVGLYFQVVLAAGAKPPYREAFEQSRPDLLRADKIVVGPYGSVLRLTRYAPGLANVYKWRDASVSGIEANILPERLGISPIEPQQIQAAILSGEKVWLVTGAGEDRFLPHLLEGVPSPARRYESTCEALTRYGGEDKERFPCIALYGWNVK